MDASIFKKYDIRGTAEGEKAGVTPEVAHWIGLGFGTHLQRNSHITQVVVGRDNRRSSFDLARAAAEGLRASGCKVIDIELVSTPIVYWQAVRHGNIGGLMVTGSHLSAEQNGFKLCVGNKNLFGSQLQAIRNFIESGDLTYGDGIVTADRSAYSKYVEDLVSRIQMPRPLKVVIDAGNGTAGLFAPRLLKAWGHSVMECLYCQPDGNFPNHAANPQEAENMEALGKRVRELKADIGIAFDGDADRMGIVNEKGEMIAADRILALLARDMLKRQPGATVVADVLSSQVLFDEVERCGGKAVMWASGHSLVKAKMSETSALLGGEMSGHIFLGENYYGYDDGFLAAGRILQVLASSDQPLSALDDTLPRMFSTPEYRPYCRDADKRIVIDGVQRALAEVGEISSVDGVRVKFPNGWGLLRASNTEPALSLRFEGETESDAMKYRALFTAALKAYPQVGALE
ncbi:MAG TPA: phosphomannomutase/phosphoglucomutase [Phototrophicaceae bacterium]|jgi:phosphomannomutase/phosphoglucomutase|nr:phosphomannomutase/phosphoglucomutase [Phototrophicaceae bacterium]